MNFELRHRFFIESARRLPRLPATHPCSQLHGHSFQITLYFRGPLDPEKGWLIDYHEITTGFAATKALLDHRLLNEIPGLENPTSENLCQWLFVRLQTQWPRLHQVGVQETRDCETFFPA